MEIFTGREGEIVLKKYSPIEELGNLAGEYAEAMSRTLGYLVCITDHDQMVAAYGPKQQEYQGKAISPELEETIKNREAICAAENEKNRIPIVKDEQMGTGAQVIQPIIAAGDAIGSVILINQKDRGKPAESDRKLAQIAAGFLGRQMEN